MKAVHKSKRADSGIALLTTMLLLVLMSSLLVGFVLLISSGQKLSGLNNDYSKSFYAAEAGMEKLTADIGTLFNANYAPTGAQISTIQTKPPVLGGISYVRFDGSPGYLVTFPPDANGNPTATIAQVKHGPFQGMTALATPYTLSVTARTTAGSEVKLQRTTQTVGIPMFQFGVFSDTDLSFFPGPTFNFGGRTHTNGNLFLAAGTGVTLSDRVTAFKDVIRMNVSNTFPTSTGVYPGPVNIFNGSGTRQLAYGEGSLVGTVGSAVNPIWSNISLGSSNYAGNLLNGAPGARQLNLGIVTLGGGTTQAIDVIRRPVAAESPTVTAERYFAQASFRILLSDDPNDIMNLPACVDTTVQPFDLSQLAQPVATWPATASIIALKAKLAANGVTPLPLAASGAAAAQGGAYTAADGYWLPKNYPVIKSYIKIEIQIPPYPATCGSNWKDVTLEVLGLGYVGRNIDPVPQSLDGKVLNPQWSGTTNNMELGAAPALPNLPATQLSYQNGATLAAGTFTAVSTTAAPTGTCLDPHPNAIIRLERIRDNPSSVPFRIGKLNNRATLPKQSTVAQACGVDPVTKKILAGWNPLPSDFWPNTLFDTREGLLRDTAPGAPLNNLPTLNGVMHYIEIDAKNLASYFGGTPAGSSGISSKDLSVAPNDFAVYISDRRGNYAAAATWGATVWPPTSPQGHETGEFGWSDFVNDTSAPTTGCTDNTLGSGEDLDGTGKQYVYGADPTFVMAQNGVWPATFPPPASDYAKYYTFKNLSTTGALTANGCAAPGYASPIWPMMYASAANAARENPPLFFRRAVKLVNGSDLSGTGACPGLVPCGLTIASENPVYVQGDYNCVACIAAAPPPNNFSAAHVATAVLGDSVTLLSNNWNDANSFNGPYSMNTRVAVTSYYRTAIMGGKGVSFPQPAGTGNDFGTDGGLHNFLRYIENWGGQTLNYRGSLVSLYYNRQGNGVFKCCNTVYSPPTRGYNFDVEFLTPSLLPPRTPLFRDVNTTGFTQLLLPTQ